jgi:hypothetical protein
MSVCFIRINLSVSLSVRPDPAIPVPVLFHFCSDIYDPVTDAIGTDSCSSGGKLSEHRVSGGSIITGSASRKALAFVLYFAFSGGSASTA